MKNKKKTKKERNEYSWYALHIANKIITCIYYYCSSSSVLSRGSFSSQSTSHWSSIFQFHVLSISIIASIIRTMAIIKLKIIANGEANVNCWFAIIRCVKYFNTLAEAPPIDVLQWRNTRPKYHQQQRHYINMLYNITACRPESESNNVKS